MDKKVDDKIRLLQKYEVKRKITTKINIDKNDDYIEIVKEELIKFLGVDSEVKRLWCSLKPLVAITRNNNVLLSLYLMPPHESSRKEVLEFVSDDQDIIYNIYKLCYKTVELWYENKSNKKGKRHG